MSSERVRIEESQGGPEMSQGSREVGFEGKVPLATVGEYLQSIIAGLKAGTVCVERGDQVLTVHPQKSVDLTVEAKAKKNKESILIEIKWYREEPARSRPAEFRITDRGPESGS